MRNVLFSVARLEFIGSGKFMVAGRNCRDELRRGDRLALRNGCGAEHIELDVDEITTYSRTVTEISHGMTAGSFFSNDLGSHFRMDSEQRLAVKMLERKPTYLSLIH